MYAATQSMAMDHAKYISRDTSEARDYSRTAPLLWDNPAP
jgi:hypothetical protein